MNLALNILNTNGLNTNGLNTNANENSSLF